MDPTVSFVGGGRWEKPDMVPGRYYVLVSASDDSRWLVEEIEVHANQGEIFFPLPLLEIYGIVTLDDDPVPGVLWLECGQESRIRFVVDEDGEFSGHLARGGSCGVEIQPSGRETTILALHAAEVQREEGEDFAYLEIELPDTQLRG